MSPAELAKQGHEAFNDRSFLQGNVGFAAPDVYIFNAANGLEYHGQEGYVQFGRDWLMIMPDARVASYANQEVDGNTVYTTFIGKGTFSGQLPTPDGQMIPGNGNALELEFYEEIEVENGEIVRITLNCDVPEMMRQLGLG